MPAGTIVNSGALVSPGGQQGIPGPNAVSTDPGNQATFGSDSKIYVPDPTPVITSVRLRSFNAVGNPTFEINQPYGAYGMLANPVNTTKLLDRWTVGKPASLTAAVSAGQNGPANTLLPGTNFCLTSANLQLRVTTPQATLAAGDYFIISQQIEGPMLRELISDVHSLSLLVNSQVAFSFAVILRDAASTRTLSKLCTITNPNTWTLITLPNLPVWASGTTWSLNPGNVGYQLMISLACGSTYLPAANDTWQSANSLGAVGMSNWLASAANTTLYFAMIQHEPGPLCTTLQDKPFSVNYDECLRYYDKSYEYELAVGTTNSTSSCNGWQQSTTVIPTNLRFAKKMAKIPTVTIYNYTTGAANSINFGGTAYAVSAVNGAGKNGFSSITTATLPAVVAGATASFMYTADTGW